MIPEKEKVELHHRIASYLLNITNDEEMSEKIIYIVDHFNAARSLFEDEKDVIEIATLNLCAASKAKLSSAYVSSLNYALTGINMMESFWQRHANKKTIKEESWNKYYDILYPLYYKTIEACFLTRDYVRMEEFSKEVMKYSKTVVDKSTIFKLHVFAYTAQGKFHESVKVTGKAVRLLGINMPEKVGKLKALIAIIKARILLSCKYAKEITELPLIQNSIIKLGIEILVSNGTSTYSSHPNFVPMYSYFGIKYALKYGNQPETCYAFNTYGLILCSMGFIEEGYKYGKIGMGIVDYRNFTELLSANYFMYYSFIYHWKNHLHDSIPQLIFIERTSSAAYSFQSSAFSCGFPLKKS